MNNDNKPKGRMFKICSNEEIGKNIRRIRRSKKISQKELAALLDKSERTIQKYEAGEIELSISTMQQIADELDVPWYELTFTNEDDIHTTDKFMDNRYQFHTMADIISALFAMAEIPELEFGISCKKPPEDSEWISSVFVNGKGNGKYDADFCLFIENWLDKAGKLQSGKMSREKYIAWQRKTLDYYSESYLSGGAPGNLQKALNEKISELSDNQKSKSADTRKVILKQTNSDEED